MDHYEAAHAAESLEAARRSRRPIAPLREQFPGMTLDDAYAVQLILQKHQVAAGHTVIGRKIGLTSLAMQQQLGVDSPDFGFITDEPGRVVHDGGHVDTAILLQPKVEPEFAFILREDLTGPDVTLEQAAAAVSSVHPAIEIIDSRIADWNIRLMDTVADNASYGAICWGQDPLDVPVDRLREVSCTLRIDDEPVGTGRGSDVMGDPLAPLQWLANTLGARGVGLQAGQVILPGSFCAAAPVRAGSRAQADFGDLGAVTVHFI